MFELKWYKLYNERHLRNLFHVPIWTDSERRQDDRWPIFKEALYTQRNLRKIEIIFASTEQRNGCLTFSCGLS